MDKYNRTPHLTWSPGGTNDDKRIVTLDGLLNREIIITEKVDGSNVCLEHDAVYARSHAKAPKHPSFDALKALHAQVKSRIPEGIQIFGEWCYAKHSIEYTSLPNYLLLFGVRDLDLKGHWNAWELVEDWAEQLEVSTVPLLGKCTGQLELASWTLRTLSYKRRSTTRTSPQKRQNPLDLS